MDEHDERDPGSIRLDDPWRSDTDPGVPGDPEPAGVPAPRRGKTHRGPDDRPSPRSVPAGGLDGAAADPRGAVYLAVHRSAAFRETRRRYRRFVLPATALFLGWYFAYVLASTLAPQFMARPVVGPLNVALLAGLGQFATTFLLTWAYARHARLRRDRAAMDLRWSVYEQSRNREDGPPPGPAAAQQGTPDPVRTKERKQERELKR